MTTITRDRRWPVERPSRFERLGRFTFRHRRLVVALWGVVIALGVVAMGPLSDRVTAEFGGSERLESARVQHRLDEIGASGGDVAIVIDAIDMDDPATVAAITERLDQISATEGVLAVSDPWRSGEEALRATDGGAGLVVVSYANGLDADAEHDLVDHVSQIANELVADGVAGEVLLGGETVVLQEFESQAEEDLRRGEAIALPIALLAMIVIFGGVRAAGMPLAIAGAGFLTSMVSLLAATYLLDSVSVFAINVVSMLGLGLGIDYGLLLVSRFREERGRHLSVQDAVQTTVGTAGVTVVYSAMTVGIAMSGMFVFGEPTMTSFGIGGLSAVAMSMAATVTLLPALLSMFGAKIRPSSPRAIEEGAFFTLSRTVQRFALPTAIVVSAVLVLLATPFLDARLENGDAASLPRSSEARAVAETLNERFPARGAEPIVVLADVAATDAAWLAFRSGIEATASVAGVSERSGFAADVTVLDVVPTGASQDDVAQGLVETLRESSASFDFEVGGLAANTLDSNAMIRARAPYAVGVVGLATFVLLFLMTGSIAIPIKAVVMNVLSLGASFGALVWIFQEGNLSGVLGFDPVGSVDLWIPVLVFLFAFGLSMDYEVFLLSRIKEIYDETGNNDLSVSIGLQRTGRIITSAALLIVVVFAGFAAGETLTIKQLGVGMALAVVVDATVVRSLLVPATMKLLGDWNWWAPAPMRRLHERFGLSEPPSAAPVAPPVDHDPSTEREAALV